MKRKGFLVIPGSRLLTGEISIQENAYPIRTQLSCMVEKPFVISATFQFTLRPLNYKIVFTAGKIRAYGSNVLR